MGVTALLQQFLKLRAFVLKPYLHLEQSAQRSLGPNNIEPGASIGGFEAIKQTNKQTNSKQKTQLPISQVPYLPSPFSILHLATPILGVYLVWIPKVIVILKLDAILGFKQQHK